MITTARNSRVAAPAKEVVEQPLLVLSLDRPHDLGEGGDVLGGRFNPLRSGAPRA